MPPRIDVSVIVGANEKLIFDCLSTFCQNAPLIYDYHIFVTLNEAKPGLAEKLAIGFPLKTLEIRVNSEPRGFAENHNAVLKISEAKYVFILNDDLIFLPESIGKLILFMEKLENEDVAVVSPKLLNPDKTLQPSTYSFPTALRAFLSISGLRDLIPFSPLINKIAYWFGKGKGRSRFWEHDQIVEVDTFRGACMLVRMKAVKDVGLMSTVSLASGEEIEWHLRFWKKGWRVIYYPEAEVIHLGSQTVRTNIALRNETLKAYLYLFQKHYSRCTFRLFQVLTMIGLLIRLFKNIIFRNTDWIRVDWEGIKILLQDNYDA